VITGK